MHTIPSFDLLEHRTQLLRFEHQMILRPRGFFYIVCIVKTDFPIIFRIDRFLRRFQDKTFRRRLGIVKAHGAFNQGSRDAFLISLKAGGVGLNLTGADTVILIDLWWNPAVEMQAISRAHRIGQEQNVEVYRLITRGTIEEKILELQEGKKNLVTTVLDGNESRASMTVEDIKEILGIAIS